MLISKACNSQDNQRELIPSPEWLPKSALSWFFTGQQRRLFSCLSVRPSICGGVLWATNGQTDNLALTLAAST